ncbi:DUF1559 family PulG-like putative transporter [Bremerella volcania]|uniref:DUF1559 family PulG-like putative transporter n=1 Tax=Bremerella volcania TaxID=2527984 RepID=UPI0013FD0391|nr:DUF1559 domain-containing protein [Bremerella volcania]
MVELTHFENYGFGPDVEIMNLEIHRHSLACFFRYAPSHCDGCNNVDCMIRSDARRATAAVPYELESCVGNRYDAISLQTVWHTNSKDDLMENESSSPAKTFLGFLALVGILIVILVVGGVVYLMIASEYAKPVVVTNKMKMIAMALQEYHQDYGAYPPAYTTDQDGTPLLSWRVLLLPYMFSDQLYQEFDLDQPWDTETNLAAAQWMPLVYESIYLPRDIRETHTPFVALAGPDTVLSTSPTAAGEGITSGGAAMAVIADHANPVFWSEPNEMSPETFAAWATLDDQPTGGTLVITTSPTSDYLDVEMYHDDSLAKLKSMMKLSGEEP